VNIRPISKRPSGVSLGSVSFVCIWIRYKKDPQFNEDLFFAFGDLLLNFFRNTTSAFLCRRYFVDGIASIF